MKIYKIAKEIKISQDFGGYFSGEVPDYAANLIGTPSVEASQVTSVFGRTNEALQMVNYFAPDALTNVAFVFNFSKGGAYGVYVPSLDRAIKTKALKKQLESKGYKILEEKGLLTAYPVKDEKTKEQIDTDIDSLWQQLNSAGGTAIGVNVTDVLRSAQNNANMIFKDMQSAKAGETPPPQVLKILNDILSIYHLAATIVHEASHSKGGDEGAAQSDEQAFRGWAQNKLNEEYKRELMNAKLEQYYTPLGQGTEVMHAKSKLTYKMADKNKKDDPNREYPVAAVVIADEKIFEGKSHAEAIQKALKSGYAIRDSDGYLIDRKGNDMTYNGSIDLFITNKGRIINRFEAFGLNEATASEDIPEDEAKKANGLNWYKTAQYSGYIPGAILGKPRGSDLEGRHNQSGTTDEGIAGWSMLLQMEQDTPIEKRLSREFMFPLNKGLDQENDVIEEQLRKQTATMDKPNPRLIMEELLSESHDDSSSYKALETLLEENRPKPLLIPIKKTSNFPKLIKKATLFGWMNNLSISDGSTIPGLGDRVMAWEDRDEDFSQEEDWIEKQPRYNPAYDLKGMYFRWIEPRFKPQLWDDMVQDYTNTHPAKRFGNKITQIDPELLKIINILGTIQKNISEGSARGTRLVASHDIAPLIEKFFSGKDGIQTKSFNIGKTNKNELIFAVWIFKNNVSEKEINDSEFYFQNKDLSQEVKEVAETVLGSRKNLTRAIEEVIEAAREICNEYNVRNLYVVGSYAREKMMKEDPDVTELSFVSNSFDTNIKIGNILAKKLGVKPKMYKSSLTLSFPYKGIRVNFQGNIQIDELLAAIEDTKNLSNPLIKDIYNIDFTINMLAYDIVNGIIKDPLGVAGDFNAGIIKTYLDPVFIIQKNPMIILRALKLKLQYGFKIDENLARAMIENANLIFDGRYSDGKIIFARESIKEYGIKKAEMLFDEFALSKIKEI